MNALLTLLVVSGAVLMTAPASAPLLSYPEMTTLDVRAQRAQGYAPCEPLVSRLPDDLAQEGRLADADNGEQSGTCEVRVSAALTYEMASEVSWHEVCHLSTVSAIYRTPEAQGMKDPAHDHPMFKDCIRKGPSDRLGYGK